MPTLLRSVLLMRVRALRAAAAAAAHMQAACRNTRSVRSACKRTHEGNRGLLSRQFEALLLTLEPWCTTCCMGTKVPLVVRGLPYVPPESCCAKGLLRRRLMLLECSGLTLAVSAGLQCVHRMLLGLLACDCRLTAPLRRYVYAWRRPSSATMCQNTC
jgi:hypothetical protein